MHWTNKYSTIFFDSLDSTNLEAKRLIDTGVTGNHVIVASEQSFGQGRSGKTWHSPLGNLYFSIVLNHNHDLSYLSQLSLVTSLSCYEALEDGDPSLFARSLKIKWPNDLLLNDKKLCGILLQSFQHIDANGRGITNHLVIGVGINLTASLNDPNYPSTSLKEEGLDYGSRDEVLNKIMESFDKNYNLWQERGFSDIRDRWLQNVHNLGKEVYLNVNGERISGMFKTIDEDGQMVIELKSGILHKVVTCDVHSI